MTHDQSESSSGIRIGIDIGGTFTDFAASTRNGRVATAKELTTPTDPASGVQTGLARFLHQNEIDPSDVSLIIHATTLVTNAIIERSGAVTGFITTAGFRDLLEIGREVRYDLYDLFLRMPQPLVPRERRVEVIERIDASGNVVIPLDTEGLERAVRGLIDAGVESVAVGFLHSYVNDTHERVAVEFIQYEFPALHVCSSSQVVREIREYERFSTAAANAYVQPLASTYLQRMAALLEQSGIRAPLHIMLSNGGVAAPATAAAVPVWMIESGPAAGALAAGDVGRSSGFERVLGFDMGGTTAKLCLVEHGEPALTHSIDVAREHRFRRGSGLPIRAPSVDLIEIGAGGGSIAYVDDLGLLAVGPFSAGAVPGPACYAAGGSVPTVTDADLLLGFLNPDYFLGGDMPLDRAAALSAIERNLATRIGVDTAHVAWGIHDMVNENMATAASVHIAEKGKDPRAYALVATGGAGPVHATGVARKIGLSTVIVPPDAGVASAIGLLNAPPRFDGAHSHPVRLDSIGWDQINDILDGLESSGRSTLRATGIEDPQMAVERSVDLRYVNQGHEVLVPLPDGTLDTDHMDEILNAFASEYRERFNRTIPGVSVEAITWRVSVRGSMQRTSLLEIEEPVSTTAAEPFSQRQVFSQRSGDYESWPVYRRSMMRPGHEVSGPAIIEDVSSTTVIGHLDGLVVDGAGNLIITLSKENLP